YTTLFRSLSSGKVDSIAIEPEHVPAMLERLQEFADSDENENILIGRTVDYLSLVARFARRLLAQQRFVPALRQSSTGELDGSWQAWFADEQSSEDAGTLVSAMPPAVRSVEDARAHDPAGIFDDMTT